MVFIFLFFFVQTHKDSKLQIHYLGSVSSGGKVYLINAFPHIVCDIIYRFLFSIIFIELYLDLVLEKALEITKLEQQRT